MEIRRLLTIEDQVLIHGGLPVEGAPRKVAAIAVITNPFAGVVVSKRTGAFFGTDDAVSRTLRDAATACLHPEPGAEYGETRFLTFVGGNLPMQFPMPVNGAVVHELQVMRIWCTKSSAAGHAKPVTRPFTCEEILP